VKNRKINRAVFWVRLTLITVYLLILIGGIVRATGSGMGCPDWPKCFGLLVPPTQESEIRFNTTASYEKGMMVIENDTLWVSKIKHAGSQGFIRANWMKYPKHDYAVFNVFQTWTEYLNRLFGALTGLFVFITLLLALSLIKSHTVFFVFSLLLLLLTGFQGWLGALVVDYHLAPLRITVHMITALAMVALLVLMQARLSPVTKASASGMTPFIYGFLFLLVLQVVFGTQVRQEVDVWMKGLVNIPENWTEHLSNIFNLHRLMAALLFFLGVFIFYRSAGLVNATHERNLLILLAFEGLAGMILSGLTLPNLLQPIHLLFSALLFGTAFRLALSVKT
jgi:cytochrome c oxidase assembly protein subunit 15